MRAAAAALMVLLRGADADRLVVVGRADLDCLGAGEAALVGIGRLVAYLHAALALTTAPRPRPTLDRRLRGRRGIPRSRRGRRIVRLRDIAVVTGAEHPHRDIAVARFDLLRLRERGRLLIGALMLHR